MLGLGATALAVIVDVKRMNLPNERACLVCTFGSDPFSNKILTSLSKPFSQAKCKTLSP
jgi:hypothetical protein